MRETQLSMYTGIDVYVHARNSIETEALFPYTQRLCMETKQHENNQEEK